MKKRGLAGAGWLTVSAALVLMDQISKLWAERTLLTGGGMPLIAGVVGFRYAENTGAAFSALSGSTALLSVVSLAICAAVAVYLLRHPEADWLTKLSLSLILAGGAGNLIDRIARGYVIDFIELLFMKFAIFNWADICVTAGAALLFIALLRGGEKSGGMER